jgi:thiamine-phosphate pyrophosphorylase
VRDFSGIYLCTPLRPDLTDFVVECVKGGVTVVQLREKRAEAKEILASARQLRKALSKYRVPFVVNDRPDIAVASDADGVHIGQEDIDPHAVRELVGKSMSIGISTHCLADYLRALEYDTEYISVGPVVETPTKPGRPPAEETFIRDALGHLDYRPRFVTGGITPERVKQLVPIGARNFVVVRYLTDSRDPRASALALRKALEESIASLH